jgi:Flp pilus assembly protein TadG
MGTARILSFCRLRHCMTIYTRLTSNIRSESGAVAVEFALLLPILLTILLGIMEFGLAFNAQITITNAAREGARALSIGGTTTPFAAVSAASAALTPAVTQAELSISPSTCTAATAGQIATVKITYPYKFFSGFFGEGFTMTGVAAMMCGG